MQKKTSSQPHDFDEQNRLIDKAFRKGKTLKEKIKNVRAVYKKLHGRDDYADVGALMWLAGYTARLQHEMFPEWGVPEPIDLRTWKKMTTHSKASRRKE